jgi:hypothetical protein
MGQKRTPRAVSMIAGALAFMAFSVCILATMAAYLVVRLHPDISLAPGADGGGLEASWVE